LEGAFLGASDYIQALRARAALNQQIRANFAQVDAFATPTMPRPPETFAALDPEEANRRPNFTNPFNLTGLPAISVPCGFTPSGLPVGMQIAGRPFDEATVLRIAHSYEQATTWHEQRPTL
ncbi:MAG: amidase family protein, partial [Candidatus Binatia bacterium]